MIDAISELNEQDQLVFGIVLGLMTGLDQITVGDLSAAKANATVRQAVLETIAPGALDPDDWKKMRGIMDAAIAFKQALNRL